MIWIFWYSYVQQQGCHAHIPSESTSIVTQGSKRFRQLVISEKDLPICCHWRFWTSFRPNSTLLSLNGNRSHQQHRPLPLAYHLHITGSSREQQRHRLQCNPTLSVIEMAVTTQENLLEDEEAKKRKWRRGVILAGGDVAPSRTSRQPNHGPFDVWYWCGVLI